MIRFFSGANPLNLLVLFFLGIILSMNAFRYPSIPLTNETDGWLYLRLMDLLARPGKNMPLIYPLLSYILIYLQAVMLNAYTNQKRVYPSLHLLTAFSVIFLSALMPEWGQWSPLLLVNTILVWIWPRLTNLYHSEKPMSDVFNAGFAVAVCAFIYFPSIYLFPLVLLALMVSRPFRFTELLISVIGLLLPFYFFFVLQYVLSGQIELSAVFRRVQWKLPWNSSIKMNDWIRLGLLLIPLLIGVIYNRAATTRMVVHTRKTWALNGLFLVTSLVMVFLNGTPTATAICFLPAVFYVTAFYALRKSKFFQELTVWGGLGWIFFQIFF